MGKVIVVTSGKGGVGKTTTVANLGCGLAKKGHRVALVDADIGLRNLDVVLGLENRIVYDLVDLAEGRCNLKQALVADKRFSDLSLVAASQVRDKNAISPEQMQQITEALSQVYDYVFIDCPAGIEQGFKNAVAGAQEAIVVVTPELSSVRDADRIIGLLTAGGMSEKNIRLLINRVRPRMIAQGDMLSPEAVADVLNLEILGVVTDDESVIVTTNRGDAAVLRRRSAAGKAYRHICERLEGVRVSIASYESAKGFARLFGFGAAQSARRKERRI